jgi:hypothetical protein
MLYGMGVFSLCGTTVLQEMEKDDEAQVAEVNEVAEAQVAEANEDLIAVKIERILVAICSRRSEEALRLIEGLEDEDINHRTQIYNITLLGAAILWNLVDVVQVLLGRGADLHMECFDPDVEYCYHRDQRYRDCTPFGAAIIDNNKKMIKLLVKHGADVNALIVGQIPLERILNNYYVQLKEDDRQDNEDLNALNDRHSENLTKDIRFFIENGANVNVKDDEGDTILHCVAGSFSHGGPFSFELVDLLFEAGADPRLANNEGKLPLQKFKLLDHVVERFPERKENYSKIVDMFQQRIDELNAQDRLDLLQK